MILLSDNMFAYIVRLLGRVVERGTKVLQRPVDSLEKTDFKVLDDVGSNHRPIQTKMTLLLQNYLFKHVYKIPVE